MHYIDLRSLNGELNFPDGRYTGFGLGDFLLGLSSAQRLTLFHEPDLYADGWQFYAQDCWRRAPNADHQLRHPLRDTSRRCSIATTC